MADANLRLILTTVDKSRPGFRKFSAGAGLAVAALGTLAVAGFVKVINVGAAFEKQMANIHTLFKGDVTPAINEMRDSIIDMSKVMPKTAEDLGAAAYDIISAGVTDAAASMNLLEVSAKASTAGLTDTNIAAQAIIAVIKGMGMSFEQSMEISDKLFTTVRLGNLTFEQLATNIGMVVPVAGAMNVSIDEVLASISTLAGVTGGTSEVVTQLESVMTGFIKPTEDMKAAIKELGFETSTTMIAELGFLGSLQAVVGTTDGTVEALGDLFGRKEAITAILALLNEQTESYNSNLKEVGESTGATDEAYGKLLKTTAAQWDILKNKLNAAMLEAASVIIPALTKTVNALGDAWNWVIDRIAAYMVWVNKAQKEAKELGGIAGVTKQMFVPPMFRQFGGPLQAGQPAIVGEAGPELFVPKESGKIIPNEDIAVSGGTNITVNVGIFAGTKAEFRNLAVELHRALKQVANQQNKTVQEVI